MQTKRYGLLLPGLLFWLWLVPTLVFSQKGDLAPGPAACENDQLVMATLWVQRSAEYKALCHQAFNLAKVRLDQALNQPHDKPLAIVADLDETILDNSPFEAMLIETGKAYSQDLWKDWSSRAGALAVPGALEFVRYAESHGVPMLYISNRMDYELDATVLNLKNLGFPQAGPDQFYLKTQGSGKEPRRIQVNDVYSVALYLGDNLNDFSDIFEDRSVGDGAGQVEKMREEFGQRFIVLPNPMYGDWESPARKQAAESGSLCRARKLQLNGY